MGVSMSDVDEVLDRLRKYLWGAGLARRDSAASAVEAAAPDRRQAEGSSKGIDFPLARALVGV